jgi:hypothetical protein
VDEYSLRQVILTDDYVAVLAEEEADGSLSLYALPLQALALADVVARTYERREGEGRVLVREEPQPMDIVGLELSEGYWEVVNDYGSFAGLCRKGEDIYQATGCLNRAGRVKRPPEVTGGEAAAS